MEDSKENLATENDFQEMSPKKRFIWRIISIILFGIVIWGVVAATDFILDFIKNMFFKG